MRRKSGSAQQEGLSSTLIFIRLIVFVLCVSCKLQSGRGYLPFRHLSCSAVVNRAFTAASSLGVNFTSRLQYKRPAHSSTYCQIFNLLLLYCVRLPPPAFLDKSCSCLLTLLFVCVQGHYHAQALLAMLISCPSMCLGLVSTLPINPDSGFPQSNLRLLAPRASPSIPR